MDGRRRVSWAYTLAMAARTFVLSSSSDQEAGERRDGSGRHPRDAGIEGRSFPIRVLPMLGLDIGQV